MKIIKNNSFTSVHNTQLLYRETGITLTENELEYIIAGIYVLLQYATANVEHYRTLRSLYPLEYGAIIAFKEKLEEVK